MEAVDYRYREENQDKTVYVDVHCDDIVRELVERSICGDIEAFGELYGIHIDRIYRYIYYQVRDKSVSEDLTEEVFLKAWTGIKKFSWKGPPFSSWLYKIAHNHIVDYFRTSRQLYRLDQSIQANSGNPEEEAEEHVTIKGLMDAIAELPHQQQQVIILKFIEGLENHEIEGILGKSRGAIRVMQMRALATLRETLSREPKNEI